MIHWIKASAARRSKPIALAQFVIQISLDTQFGIFYKHNQLIQLVKIIMFYWNWGICNVQEKHSS